MKPVINYLAEHFGTASQIEALAIAHHNKTGQLVRPYHKDNAAANYQAANAHHQGWQSIKMMVDYNIKEYGEYEALARATQGGHTNSYAQVVLQILPKEDVSAIIRESTGLDGRTYFEKLGTILAEHKSELHSLCKKFNCLNPPYMADQFTGLPADNNPNPPTANLDPQTDKELKKLRDELRTIKKDIQKDRKGASNDGTPPTTNGYIDGRRYKQPGRESYAIDINVYNQAIIDQYQAIISNRNSPQPRLLYINGDSVIFSEEVLARISGFFQNFEKAKCTGIMMGPQGCATCEEVISKHAKQQQNRYILPHLMIRKTNVSVGAPPNSANNCPMALHLSLKDRIDLQKATGTCKLC